MSAPERKVTKSDNPVHLDQLWRDRIEQELQAEFKFDQKWKQLVDISRTTFSDSVRAKQRTTEPTAEPLPDFGHEEFMATRRTRDEVLHPTIPSDVHARPTTETQAVGWRKDWLERGLFNSGQTARRRAEWD